MHVELTSKGVCKLRGHIVHRRFLQLDGLITSDEVEYLKSVYSKMTSGELEGVSKHRYDLGSSSMPTLSTVENITQASASAALSFQYHGK
jgi:hypothetical protein